MRKVIAFLAVAVASAAGWAAHWYSSDTVAVAQARTAAPAIPVTAGTAEARNMPVYVSGLGTVQAYNTVTVKSRVDGQIVKVDFTEGQEVKAGDPLFEIDPRPYQAALEQATANKQ